MATRSDASLGSSIPQLSRNASPTKGRALATMSTSSTNSRSHPMAPPAKVPRKTLKDRMEEFPESKPGQHSFAPGSAYTNAGTRIGQPRNGSFSSSLSSGSRPHSSASSRAFSNTSYSSSVGPGSRPATSVSHRTHLNQSGPRAQRSAYGRPASSLESHDEEGLHGQVVGQKRKAFNIDQKWEEMETFREQITEQTKARMEEHNALKEAMVFYKSMVKDLENRRDELSTNNHKLQQELDESRSRVQKVMETSDEQRRLQCHQLDESAREHRRELDRIEHERESEKRRLIRDHDEVIEDIQRGFEAQISDERGRHQQEIETLNSQGTSQQQEIEKELDAQLAALKTIEDDIDKYKLDLSREQDTNNTLRDELAAAAKKESDLERSVQRLEGHIQFLQSDNQSQSQAFADLEARMQKAIRESEEAKAKLVTEETLRRKLHNQVQELKGNIRVFCRVRPALESDSADPKSGMAFPDHEVDAKELEVTGPEEKSSLGKITTKKHPFSFDRVFGPASQNQDVFAEISQLVQSALDGYNVCIFCYGQTGSGKTHTMSSADGMIPLAVNQIYSTAKALEEKGWTYTMVGSFIEVYNENLNDLLGNAEDLDKKKHEIRHDTQKCKTEITGIQTVELDRPERVDEILQRASKNRTVAATQANERSSRSHSVFILRLNGTNSITGEVSEGTLNLVDLAGSERLSHSGATGERLKETQNINKSLSCLGDVIGALGQGKEGGHIPYRNSKLTYLLQFSLGGNSKTLMFVMISPLQAHLQETLTSLKFATKVHNTHIGTAKKQSKVKD